ncbi:DDE family endonuclease [Rhizoctonia solani AG-3 Rhs1AP]|uniref:DDE family endonuclease n=1 Tax=Rhizoctonia solani AG-3 Rhs1AP TaxID=1086054 RepID=X8J5T3_9AGAM|nr:DDE family endonuclease [Rhizoctonia solani AG-3 Rhs1AP]
MPAITEHVAATKTLTQAFIYQAVQEAQDMNSAAFIDSLLPPESSDSSLGSDLDLSLGSESDNERGSLQTPLHTTILPLSDLLAEALAALHSSHYLNERISIQKSGEMLTLTLYEYRNSRPEIFRDHLRVNPHTFDALVAAIIGDPVFQNNSNNSQIPVDQQVAVALYRLGHYGNAVSVKDVGLWAGWGAGTVDLVTRRFFVAICRPNFYQASVSWPTAEEQESAMEWVESQTCFEWHNGWLMVDGTLVILDRRPGHYGNSYYDRKCNYSLNVQIICLPNLRIIDFGVGLPGSQHDAAAWKHTRLPTEHVRLLGQDDWIWGDSAYPIRKWIVSPYKVPEKNIPQNAAFNYQVSRVRVRSEHCNALLKGRFPSLRGLRVRIDNSIHTSFATIWVTVCVALHNFALVHEGGDYIHNNFFEEGRQILREEAGDEVEIDPRFNQGLGENDVEAGKTKREEIKRRFFEA